MKRKISLVVALMLMALTVFGCGKREELENTQSSSLSDTINDEEAAEEECPEGYVYDYQVSMEPIPEEIAALGGDVCGTIHAYPTRIEIALAQQEIENDAELKEQNEKNIEGVKQYLAEAYGGEFEIEPLTTGIWSYKCTEISSGKVFFVYIPFSFINGYSEEVVDVDTYFYESDAQKYNNDIELILVENEGSDYCFRARCETIGEDNILYIKVGVFREDNINHIEEQKMILVLYEQMIEAVKSNDRETRLAFTITYFKSSYKDVITKQYQSNNILDMAYIYDECAEKLLKKNEILAQFEYHESFISEDENELKKISEDPETYYANEYILPYWR